MRILVVNPNSTASMTDTIAAAARRVARPDTRVAATNPADGPPSIQGYLDGAACFAGLADAVSRAGDCDAVVVACFDDTGVDALRCALDVPIIGIGEAACHAAAMICAKFTVVTTLARSVAVLEANLLRYGLDRKCGSVRASDVPVLKLENGDEAAVGMIRRQIRDAIDRDGAEAIVLGCAGMTDLAARLAGEFAMPVIDGVACGVTMAEALVASGLKTSKKKTYAAT
ncbi:aspartate/glutamate racemase family protein [Hoeflea sp.]|uniref:aspartate/glutamate racemase family protein n=1 Tax=Hoeflea sp. TaxID=1940281 RepID=UPI003B010FF3